MPQESLLDTRSILFLVYHLCLVDRVSLAFALTNTEALKHILLDASLIPYEVTHHN